MRIWYHTHQLPKTFTHSHMDFEIMYCVSGAYTFHYADASGNRKTKQIESKTMIFIPKNVPHGVEQVAYPYRRFFLHLPVHQTINLLDSPLLVSPFQRCATSGAEKSYVPSFLDATKSASIIEPIFERMVNVCMLSKNSICNELHLRCLLGLLFCELNQNHHDFFIEAHTVKGHLVNEVRMYIDEHSDQQLSINDLAKRFYVHPSYLSHQFAQQVGISPRKYLTDIRLANARKQLLYSDDTIQNIALRVGFSDVNNFIQSFRARFGATPKQYRKKILMEIKG